MTKTPTWAKPDPVDQYGNVACKACGNVQSDSFSACIACCQHDELEFIERWHGGDEGGGWELEVECVACGKDHGFSRDFLMSSYKVVRK